MSCGISTVLAAPSSSTPVCASSHDARHSPDGSSVLSPARSWEGARTSTSDSWVNDYARERLGLSARELQSVAKVAADLHRLPALAAAFARGELSWTKTRIIGAVATGAIESTWIDAARDLTVRAFEELVRATTANAEVAATPSSSLTHRERGSATSTRDAADDADADTLDGEPTVRFRLLCPRALRPLWRVVVELARRMAGEPLPVWRAAEAIAAEGLSGAALPPERPVASAPPAHHAAPPVGSADGADLDAATDIAVLDASDAAILAAAFPALEPLAEGLDRLDAFGLDERLRAVVTAMHAVDWETGRLLRFLVDLRLHTVLGFPDAGGYVRERLGFSPRKARALIAVERATWHFPALAASYRAGEISWFRALLVLPILRETTAAAWLVRSAEITARRLVDEVDWALSMQDLQPLCSPVTPPPLGGALEFSPRQLRARAIDDGIDAVLTFRAPASVAALLHAAIAAFTAPGEPGWPGCERLLEHVRTEWEGQPRHRDPIFARDGWRCTVPACSSRRNLHDHHVVFRSRGGYNARDNRITVCAGHHLHGIHAGRVRAWGHAPEAIRWELGVRPRGDALLTLEGDRYVTAAALLPPQTRT